MAYNVADTFAGRTIADTASASGWGTASDGNTWALISGFAAGSGTLGTSSGEGRATNQANNTPWRVALGSATAADVDASVRFELTNAGDHQGIFVRTTDSTHFLLIRYNSAGVWQVLDQPGTGTVTTDISAAIALTPTLSTFYWLRVRAVGSTVQVKVWADGGGEPSSFQSSTTVSQTSAGLSGLYVFTGSTNTQLVDSFNAVDAFTALSASAATGTGVATNAALAVAVPLAAAAATGVGVAPNALLAVSAPLTASAGLGVGVAPSSALLTAVALQGAVGVGIGIATNATLGTGGGALTAAAGVGVGISGATAALLVSVALSASAGLGTGIATNATLGTGSGAFTTPTATIAPASGEPSGVVASTTRPTAVIVRA